MHRSAFDILLGMVAGPLVGVMIGAAVLLSLRGVYEAGLGHFLDDVNRQESGPMNAILRVLIGRLAPYAVRFSSADAMARLKRKMIMAGLDMRETLLRRPEDFLGMQVLAALGGAAFVLYLWMTVHVGLIWIPLAMVGVGWFLPRRWLTDQTIKRHLLITRALPYNLDLLTLSVEAGLDFSAALQKVIDKGRKGPLNDELALVLRQLKMGKTRAESLKTLADRVNLSSLTTFVSALIQADRMGTPLGKVLRIQSQQLREERTQRAEKLAGEAPVKMLGPLIMCIMPTVFLILFGPVIFQLKFGQF